MSKEDLAKGLKQAVEEPIDDSSRKIENEKPAEQKRKLQEPYVTEPPFPQRLKKKKGEVHFEKFLDILKGIHITIPLIEMLKQMPKYVKFLKDMLSSGRKFEEFKVVALNKKCSAILKNKLPLKEKDLGSFTTLVSIGGRELGRALCDLWANINLMPLSIYWKLGIGEARSTTITLQLVDISIVHLEGKIEDILIQVDKFIFPTDFVILSPPRPLGYLRRSCAPSFLIFISTCI